MWRLDAKSLNQNILMEIDLCERRLSPSSLSPCQTSVDIVGVEDGTKITIVEILFEKNNASESLAETMVVDANLKAL